MSRLYRQVLTEAIIVECKEKPAVIKQDLGRRNLHRVPPGYKDASKELGGAGDLIICHTILQIGAERKSHLVFVSGDEKSDWWYRTAEGALYPRFELLDEYRRASGGASFHIITLAELLQRTGARPAVVDVVRVEEAATAATNDQERKERLERAMAALSAYLDAYEEYQRGAAAVAQDPEGLQGSWPNGRFAHMQVMMDRQLEVAKGILEGRI